MNEPRKISEVLAEARVEIDSLPAPVREIFVRNTQLRQRADAQEQEHKALVRWVPPAERPEALKERDDKLRLKEAKQIEAAARAAVAKRIKTHADIQITTAQLVLNEMQKFLRLSQSPDFENAIGPLDPKLILKMADYVSKGHRLDTGQATENIAHAVRPSIDFSKLTQEERDAWRMLALKGGGGGGDE